MNRLFTTAEAARILTTRNPSRPLVARTVRLICRTYSIGLLPTPRLRLLTTADLVAVSRARKKRGNPNFGKAFGNGRKVASKKNGRRKSLSSND